jgi:hypothetical protein
MITRTLVALSIAAISIGGAQESATFILKSGERLSGQLVDMSGAGFTVQVNGQPRQISTNDMAVIDFTGAGPNQSDWDRLSGGQFAVLKDGQVVTGQLTDVGGTAPLRLSFNSNGANRDIQSNQVARIVLARPNDAAASGVGTGGSTPSAPVGITVSGRNPWTPTGLTVRRGEPLTINASGEVRIAGPTGLAASPAGSSETFPSNPLPGVPTGALIGRIGNGQPFLIGNQTQVSAPAAGQLFLGVNDSNHGDNEGSFQVQVTPGGGTRRR